MTALIKNLQLAIISIVIGIILYGLLLWVLDRLSIYLGMQSIIGDFIGDLTFWLGHFGLGPLLLPILIITIFNYIYKRNANVTHSTKDGK